MKVGQAFPGILDRRYPIVKADYSLLTVLYLLRIQGVEAVPISPVLRRKARAVFAYSTLPRMLSMTRDQFDRFLQGPCGRSASDLAVINDDDDLELLLSEFDVRRLGFAAVHTGKATRISLVTLADFLALYAKDIIRSTMTVGEATSEFTAMPGSTTLRGALEAMIAHRYRRVFLSGMNAFVSDRSIIHYLLDPMFLEDFVKQDKDILSARIDEIDLMAPARIAPDATMREAATALLKDRVGCLTVGDNAILTPWDVVMKPWKAGLLHWRESGRRR